MCLQVTDNLLVSALKLNAKMSNSKTGILSAHAHNWSNLLG